MNDSRGNNGRYLILVCCVMMKRERPALGDPFSDLASLASSAKASQSSMSRHELWRKQSQEIVEVMVGALVMREG